MVHAHEVAAIRDACASLGLAHVEIVFIVVQKRSYARFFKGQHSEARVAVSELPPYLLRALLWERGVQLEQGKPAAYYLSYFENANVTEVTQAEVYELNEEDSYVGGVRPQQDGNPNPGTVVDTAVVSKETFDFYLQSHYGLKGTARPAHYTVLRNDANLGSDEIQTLTHELAHMFGRCTKVVSGPAPTCMAHRGAEMASFLNDHYSEATDSFSDTASVASGVSGGGGQSAAREQASGGVPKNQVSEALLGRHYYA